MKVNASRKEGKLCGGNLQANGLFMAGEEMELPWRLIPLFICPFSFIKFLNIPQFL